MIEGGRFSASISQALIALILEPHRDGQPIPDHELRFVAGNGFCYAIYSISIAGRHALMILAFERGRHPVTQESKNAMFKVLAIAEPLCGENLHEKRV